MSVGRYVILHEIRKDEPGWIYFSIIIVLMIILKVITMYYHY